MAHTITSLIVILFTYLSSVAGEGNQKATGLVPNHQPKKYGLLDVEGKVVSACQWDSAGEFYHGVTIVEKDGKMGLLDAKGKLLIPCIWDDVSWFFHENRAAVLLDGKMGFIDRTGKVAIKLEWDWCGRFRGDLAEVEQDDLYGLIDLNGKVVVKPEWDEIRFTEHLVMCERDKKTLLMDTRGKILNPTMWDKVTIYSDELVAGEKDRKTNFLDSKGDVIVNDVIWIGHGRNQFEHYNLFSIQKEEGWGYISRDGELLSMPQWDKGKIFNSEHIVVTKGAVNHILYKSGKQVAVPQYHLKGFSGGLRRVVDKKTMKIGYLDESLKLVIPCVWGPGSQGANDGRIVVEHDGLLGAIDYKGKMIIPTGWDDIASFQDGEPSFVIKNGVYGFIDRDGKLITKVEFDDCFSFHEGHAVMLKGEKSWFIDINGKVVNQLDGIAGNGDGGYLIKKNGKIGAVDFKGDLIAPMVWDEIEWSDNDSDLVVTKQNFKGLVSNDGKIVTPAKWDEIVSFDSYGEDLSKLHWVKKGGKWGAIDDKGKLLLEPMWLKIDWCISQLGACDGDPELTEKQNTNEGYVVTDEHGKQGYVSVEGQLTIPAIYDELYFVGDMGYAKKGMLTGFIHKSGRVISECQWDDYYELSEGLFVVQAPLRK